jgi:hypothetical protein
MGRSPADQNLPVGRTNVNVFRIEILVNADFMAVMARCFHSHDPLLQPQKYRKLPNKRATFIHKGWRNRLLLRGKF